MTCCWMQGPVYWFIRWYHAGAARHRTFRKYPNRRIPALFATGVEIVSRSFVAMLVGNHHGNGIPTKPLTRSTLPQPWQPFAYDRRKDLQPPLYSFPGSICECRSRP